MTGARERPADVGTGWLWFAAVVMFVAGFHNIIYGIVALDKNTYLTNQLLFQDLTFWGWLWLCVGAVEVLAAFALVGRSQWARWFGIAICTFNAIGQLAFLRAFPVWSVVIIALDILVIYALTTYATPRGVGLVEPYPPAAAGQSERVSSGAGAHRAGEPGADKTRAATD